MTLDLIEAAAGRIAPFVHRTPLTGSEQLSEMLGCRLSFKCENLQKTGAFKARGAHNAVMQLSDEEAARGVCTHSSGNHAAALALAARNRGVPVYVVMPESSPKVKREAVAGYGAEIVLCKATLAAREARLADLQQRTGAHFVHPYDDPRIICGQGTVGLEIHEQSGDDPTEVVIVPVGGGGLLAGVAVATKSLRSRCEVIAAEPAGADDAQRSFRSGRLQPLLNPNSIADGLLTSLGSLNFELMQGYVDDVVTVTDERIAEAMQLIWSRCKLVVEPSAAVTLAAVMDDRERFRGRRVSLVLSGGNADLSRLPWIAR